MKRGLGVPGGDRLGGGRPGSRLLLAFVAVVLAMGIGSASASAGTAEDILALPVLDPLNRNEDPLSNGGKWSDLAWSNSASGHNRGTVRTNGWGPYDAFSTVNGAYWNPSSFGNDGGGAAAALTMQASPSNAGRYVSLWLGMPSPGSAKTGYELRWTVVAGSLYSVKLSKWSNGTETVLASNPQVEIPTGETLAISDTGGTVAAWHGTSASLTPLLSANDVSFAGGYAGFEGSGNISRSLNFKAGALTKGPLVTTLDASAVGTGHATLNASVNPNGSATTYQFEYGATSSLGSTVPVSAKAAGSGTTAVGVSEQISGLTNGTTYHFRISASNANGAAKGDVRTFATAAAPAAATKEATDVAAEAATLNATVNPRGAATSYHFEYGPTAAYGAKVPIAPNQLGAEPGDVSVSASAEGLTEGSKYHFRVVAANEVGTTYGQDQTFETPLLPAVATESSTPVNANEAVLAGSVDPNGSETSYRFEYGTTTDYGSVVPKAEEQELNGTSEQPAEEAVAFLEPETTYHYRIIAESDAGTVVGADRTLTTSAAAVSPQQETEERQEELAFTAKFTGPLPDRFVNLNWAGHGDEGSPQRMEIIRNSGAKMLRLGIEDVSTFPSFKKMFNEVFYNAAKRGIRVLFILGSKRRPARADWSTWMTKAEEIVNYYGKGGAFWAEHGLTDALAPTYWEVWNEPNAGGINGNSEGRVAPVEFGEFLARAAKAVENADSDAKILLGGLLAVQKGKGEEDKLTPAQFIKNVGHEDAYDAVSVHPYAFKVRYANDEEGPPKTAAQAEDLADRVRNNIFLVREALDDLPGTSGNGKDLWITELGWPVENPDPTDPGHPPVSPEIQARLVHAAFNRIKAKSKDWKIRNVFLWNTKDGNPPDLSWDDRSGLQNVNGGFRPSWYAFQEQAGKLISWPARPVARAKYAIPKPNRAALIGALNPNGLTTSWRYRWRPANSSSWSFTPWRSSWAEEGQELEVSEEITGLVPQREYEFGLVAVNENGEEESNGGTVKFTTPPKVEVFLGVRHVLPGQPGFVWVAGNVKEGAVPSGSGPWLPSGRVLIEFRRDPNEPHPVETRELNFSNGQYESGYWGRGHGLWYVQARFPAQNGYPESVSGVHDFYVHKGVMLVAKHSEKCMDVSGASTANGAAVMHGNCGDPYSAANQVFSLVPHGESFQIVARHSGKCVDIANVGSADGTAVQQYDCLGVDQLNQLFLQTWWGGSKYATYAARHSGKCLDVTGGSLQWAPFQQWTCNGSPQQLLYPKPVDAGPIPSETFLTIDQYLHGSPGLFSVHGHLRAATHSMANRVVRLEFDNADTAQWDSSGGNLPITVGAGGYYEARDFPVPPGRWNIRARFVGDSEFGESWSAPQGRTLKRGYLFVNRYSGMCLQVSERNNGVWNGQPIIQWPCSAVNGNGQVASFWPRGGGFYDIRINGTNKCVDVSGVSQTNGAWLQLWECLGSGNQQWRREGLGGANDGWYGLRVAHSGKCVDDLDYSTKAGTRLGQWDCHWGGNQQWALNGVIDP